MDDKVTRARVFVACVFFSGAPTSPNLGLRSLRSQVQFSATAPWSVQAPPQPSSAFFDVFRFVRLMQNPPA